MVEKVTIIKIPNDTWHSYWLKGPFPNVPLNLQLIYIYIYIYMYGVWQVVSAYSGSMLFLEHILDEK